MNEDTWQALVDPRRLRDWMDRQGIGSGSIDEPRLLSGGTQNILLHFWRDGRAYVLRRSPQHPRGDGNATIRREARVLAALASSSVPHPGLIAACDETDVIGAAFYIMEPVDGFNATVTLPPLHQSDAAARRRMGFALVEGALAMGRVDHVAVGLSDFGKSDGFLERQVPRWRRLLDSYRDFSGWPGPDGLPNTDIVAEWLKRNTPAAFTPGLMHGDYHLSNVMYRNDGPELAAIVDWELCTIGDPLLDMGWIMATWPDPDGQTTADLIVEPWDNFPVIEELIEHYRAGSDRDTSHLPWYGVLACYKLGIIVEGTYARACAGLLDQETGDQLHRCGVRLFGRAAKWIDQFGPVMRF